MDAALSETAYMRNVATAIAPAQLDWVARQAGVAPPRQPGRPFRHLDLGCGYGTTSLLLAAARPEGEFVGIDILAAHAEDGNEWADRAGLGNARFLCGSFGDALAGRLGELGRFDYVTAHGVLAWIPEPARAELFDLIEATLAPGGLAYLGYNCETGWAPALPLQRFVRAYVDRTEGGPLYERAVAAFGMARRLRDAGAQTLRGVALPELLLERASGLPASYLIHEYLPPDWRPMEATEVLDRMAAGGLARLGSARPMENRDDFMLRRDQRKLLEAIDDPAFAELVRDMCRSPTFRSDVFARAERATGAGDAEAQKLAQHVALRRPADRIAYEVRTDAGTLRFDNAAAHAIVDLLAAGPASLQSIADGTSEATEADILNSADALLAAEAIGPVDPPLDGDGAVVDRVNGMIRESLGSGNPTLAQATRFGVARTLGAAAVAFLSAGPQADADALRTVLARLLGEDALKEAEADADAFIADERPFWRSLGVT